MAPQSGSAKRAAARAAKVTTETEPPAMNGLFALSVLVAVIVSGIYIATAHRSVPGGDSGELISTSWELGVAHPPGYPLWTMLNHVWMRYLFPVGSPAFRTNVFSSLAGGAAAGVLCHATAWLAHGSAAAGIVAAGLFALTRLTWMYSIQGEVFALNNLFVAVLLWLAVRFAARRDVPTALWGAWACGAALTNQLTAVLFIVVLVPWVLAVLHAEGRLTTRVVTWLAAAFLLGFSPYLYLPWSAWRNEARLTWGDQRTLAGFVKHVLREEYGTFALAKGDRSTSNFWLGLATHAAAFARETSYAGPALAALGLWVRPAYAPAATAKGVAVAAAVFYLWFFNWRANLDLSNKLLAGVQERFWMQANMVGALLAGLGFAWLAARVSLPRVAHAAFAVALVAAVARGNVQDESRNTAVGDFGRTLLTGLPPNAILLLLGDLPGNAARYMQACEGVRPDVRLIDLEMMTFDWYLPMLEKTFPGVVFPANIKTYRFGENYFDMNKFFEANIDKFDIFVFEKLNEEDKSWTNKFELWHAGLAKAVKRRKTKLDTGAWYQQGMQSVGTFALPDPTVYDDRTWEFVVHDGQLISAVSFALFFEERAKAERKDTRRVELRQAAIEVYTHLFENPVFEGYRPGFWDKNFGLSAWEQFQMTKNESLVPLIKSHWTRYIESDVQDVQKGAMQEVLTQLPAPDDNPNNHIDEGDDEPPAASE